MDDRSFDFAPETGEMFACQDFQEPAVQQVQFDSFGERLPDGGAQAAPVQQGNSRWMLFCVIGFFWVLIAAAVAARVIYAGQAS